ncbi:MAG TPA: phosphosulfolactate synthase [Acidimicrobiales bacterium]|nr:phosphosulfolactate synthase [Acidimicrobiales bacterium]
MPAPGFLRLPDRSGKPRRRGRSWVIDGGLPLAEVGGILESASPVIDGWKLGWGSAYLDPALEPRLALLRRHDVIACPGGTLLEFAAYQRRTEECLDWLSACGFTQVEVSDGLGLLGEDAKAALIERAAASFTVVSEVGLKEPTSVLTPETWVESARADLDAGAAMVIAEGRESGTVGLYTADGSVRTDVVDALLAHVGPERLLFEAPRKDQQAWLIRHVGPEVNLANVSPRDALGLEALRLGLRADTTLAVHPPTRLAR